MPQPLFIFIIVIMLLMVVIAVGVILNEVGKAARRIWRQRAVSATWISKENPGLLDFEADFKKGSNRFTIEMKKLGNDTQRLATQLNKHQKQILKLAKSSSPRKKQKIANKAAKDIGRSAAFISKRKELFDALVNEIHRNGSGLLSVRSFDEKEDIETGYALQKTLGESVNVTKVAVDSLSKYRESTKSLRDRNLSRTIRVESDRLMEALDHISKTLQRYNANSQKLNVIITKKLPPNQ